MAPRGRLVERGRHWLEHPAVQRRIKFKIGGTVGPDRFRYFLDKYFPRGRPLDRVLTLGCGGGEFERGLARYNFARLREAVAIAEGRWNGPGAPRRIRGSPTFATASGT